MKKEYLLLAALCAVVSLTCIAIFFTMPSIEYILTILLLPAVVYSMLWLGEKLRP
ncbi:MAG: hypothetical protein V4658_04990 [Bacteroidota bacterium]